MERQSRFHDKAIKAFDYLITQKRAVTYTDVGNHIGVGAHSVPQYLDCINRFLADYNAGHSSNPVPPLCLLVVRKDTHVPGWGIAPVFGLSKKAYRALSTRKKHKLVQPTQNRAVRYQRWSAVFADFRRHASRCRCRSRGAVQALGVAFLAGLLLSLPTLAHSGLCDGWGGLFIYDTTNVQRCLTEGRYVNARDPRTGETPLMGAALIGDVAAVQMLLQAGAQATTQDKAGMTALDWAKRFQRSAVVTILEQAQ